MRFFITSLIFLTSIEVNAQIVSIPDTTFRNYLINNSSINTNGDSLIQVSEASQYSGTISCQGLGIYDLTGIEAFTNVTSLLCYQNFLDSIDLSSNIALTMLNAYQNNFSEIDLTNNVNLVVVRLQENQLSSIDVSQNTLLTELILDRNNLSVLNVTSNTELVILGCYENNLSGAIDVSNNSKLEHIRLQENQITSIDLSNNPNLVALTIDRNSLTTLNVSNNPNLVGLGCYENNLQGGLDLSNNPMLEVVKLMGNNLTCLNLRNGNNSSIYQFGVVLNPSLTCIQVDDSLYSAQNWTGIDSQMYFSESCSGDCNQPPLSVSHITKPDKKELVRIIDLLGKETKPEVNTIQVYQYSDGSFEKRVVIE
jgi:hypothetical protein